MKYIKPCPFCGSEARLEHEFNGAIEQSYCECTNFECLARTKSVSISTRHSSDDEALEIWNRREK